MAIIEEIRIHVETGKTKLVSGLVQNGLDNGTTATDILQAMIDGMDIVGEKFSSGSIFVPEMLIAAKAMSKGMDVLKPYLAGDSSTSLGTCIIGTVQGDLHDIGKNLVAMMLESAGFKIIDLGVDVPAEKFINAIKAHEDVKLVACSALLTTTIPALQGTVDTIKDSGLNGFKIMIGGAPITEEFATKVGADGFAPEAGSAVAKAKELIAAV